MFERQNDYKKNLLLESLIQEVNNLLYPAEEGVISAFNETKYPIILVVGCPRSGTTLFMQWLASLGYFCYPTNILSRFYATPYVGAKIQLMLTQSDAFNEIFNLTDLNAFDSRLGKTKGALAPHEFWYFWRRFFPFEDLKCFEDGVLEQIDFKTFKAELAAIENVFDKPLAMKGMVVNGNLPFVDKLLDKVLFVYVKRNPYYNIQSLIKARLEYYGDISAWFSYKPSEYNYLTNVDPYKQVAGQVYYTNKGIHDGLSKIEAERYIEVEYEQFCHSPKTIFDQITSKYESQGFSRKWHYTGPLSFQDRKEISLTHDQIDKIKCEYFQFSGNEITF